MRNNLFSRDDATKDAGQEHFPSDFDVCFQIPESGELQLDIKTHGASTLEYLTYCIIRNPSDLVSHLRRILLQEKIGDSENLYSGLVDLFIALGNRGEALRSRLLTQYRARLSSAQYEALSRTLTTGGVPNRASENDAAVLAKGLVGTCSLIRPVIEPMADRESRDPLAEARDYLEYSQIDEAREVLERAVLENPERIEFQSELLELYRAGRDGDRFKRIYRELKRSGTQLSNEWAAMSEFLSEHA